MKVARTVLRGGKFERTYLSQVDTQVFLSVNDEWLVIPAKARGSVANAITIPPCKYDCKVENKKISRFRSKRSEACYLIR